MKRQIVFLTLLSLVILHIQIGSAFETGISSMVKITNNTFLTVTDRKNAHKKDGPVMANTKPRFGIVTVEKKWVSFDDLYIKYPLTISNMPPNDLEAICALPHRPHEVLVAESGFLEGKYGRVFHMRLKEKHGKWKAEFVTAFRPLSPKDVTYSTPKKEQIEGMACIETPKRQIIVVLALRGGHKTPGMLIWGMLEGLGEKQPRFMRLGETALSDNHRFFGNRDASDLYLEKKHKKKWRIWTIAVDDPDEDFGPFRSVIYSPGVFVWEDNKTLYFQQTEPIVGWKRDGLKVEALAAPAERVTGSVLSIGTEDEALGGMWQPLFPTK